MSKFIHITGDQVQYTESGYHIFWNNNTKEATIDFVNLESITVNVNKTNSSEGLQLYLHFNGYDYPITETTTFDNVPLEKATFNYRGNDNVTINGNTILKNYSTAVTNVFTGVGNPIEVNVEYGSTTYQVLTKNCSVEWATESTQKYGYIVEFYVTLSAGYELPPSITSGYTDKYTIEEDGRIHFAFQSEPQTNGNGSTKRIKVYCVEIPQGGGEEGGEIALAGMLADSDPDYGGSSFTLASYGNRNTLTVNLKEDGCSFEIPMSDFGTFVSDTATSSSDGKYRQIFKTGSRQFRKFTVFNIPVNNETDDAGYISMRGLFDTCKLHPIDEGENVIDLRNTGDWTNVNIYREMFKSMGATQITFILPSGFFENAYNTNDIFKSTPSNKTFVCDLMSDTAFDNFRACVPSTQNENFVFKKGDITYTTASDESGNTYWTQG